ncbi:MAG: 50S ribosomal protein L25 [bacterium]|nr:50S ribosomal protein L25 [bacterium]
METITLLAQQRTIVGKKLKSLRVQKLIPAVLYGREVATQMLSVPVVAFDKTYNKAGESALVDLDIEGGETLKVLIHDVARDPVKGTVQHVDFYQVNMKEELTTEIPLVFVGESKAVKELGGTLVKSIEELEVRCLPSDLVHEITVDISSLITFEDVLKVKDVILPSGMAVLSDIDDVLVSVDEPATDEELAALEEKPVEDVGAVEIEEKGKEKDEKEGEGEKEEEKK